jgi:signal peptidase I
MAPTLQVGDHVLANKLVYDFSDPERGDLVVFNSVEAKNDELEVSGTGGRFPRSP